MAVVNGKKKSTACQSDMLPIRDALDVISGKWKMMILVSLMHGHRRFTEIQRSIPKINAKVLSKELKDLEVHQLITRTVRDEYPVLIEYAMTDYAHTLSKVMKELHAWGVNHRKKIIGK